MRRETGSEMKRMMSRRSVLRGLGVALALPALEAFMPRRALGAEEAAALGASVWEELSAQVLNTCGVV